MHRKKCWWQPTRKREHITPVLKELHWLPVKQRIDHKIMPLAYKCYEGTAPEYLQELIPRYVHAPTLLPSSGMLYHKQSGKQKWRRFANVWKHLFCEWLCTMCLFLVVVYDFLSTPPPPTHTHTHLWAFKLMETSDKARHHHHHHHHHQLKATKHSISLRHLSTTTCSRLLESFNLRWGGGEGGLQTPHHPDPPRLVMMKWRTTYLITIRISYLFKQALI